MPSTVYIETTIIGHLSSRLPQPGSLADQMIATRKWWDEAHKNFQLYSSELVLEEISKGDPVAAAERIAVFNSLPLLNFGVEAFTLAEKLFANHALPLRSKVDATHLAIAAVSGIEYLLTWNCKHLANATLRSRIESTCVAEGFEPPIICTPYELEVIP